MLNLIWLLSTLGAVHSVMAWTWTERSVDVPTPKRSGHTAFLTPSGPMIFGGYAEDDPSTRYTIQDLWSWDEGRWRKKESTGEIPEPRLVAASAVSGGKAYLFGGWNPATPPGILDDVHELDLDTLVWKKLDCTMPDGPTSRHVAVALGDGNILLHTHRCKDYVLLFDPKNCSFRKQETSGPCPSSRGLHGACRVDDDTVLLFGGAAQDQTMSGETFLLNIKTWTFKRITDGPSPRAAPCLSNVGPGQAVLFGGATSGETGLQPLNDLWAFQADKWTRIETHVMPPGRNAATLFPISDREFVLTGGWRPFVETHDDCFILSKDSAM